MIRYPAHFITISIDACGRAMYWGEQRLPTDSPAQWAALAHVHPLLAHLQHGPDAGIPRPPGMLRDRAPFWPQCPFCNPGGR